MVGNLLLCTKSDASACTSQDVPYVLRTSAQPRYCGIKPRNSWIHVHRPPRPTLLNKLTGHRPLRRWIAIRQLLMSLSQTRNIKTPVTSHSLLCNRGTEIRSRILIVHDWGPRNVTVAREYVVQTICPTGTFDYHYRRTERLHSNAALCSSKPLLENTYLART